MTKILCALRGEPMEVSDSSQTNVEVGGECFWYPLQEL